MSDEAIQSIDRGLRVVEDKLSQHTRNFQLQKGRMDRIQEEQREIREAVAKLQGSVDELLEAVTGMGLGKGSED